VLAAARPLHALRVYAPNGISVDLRAKMACLPRSQLDQLMRQAAEEAGATFLAPYALVRAVEEDGVVVGAAFAPVEGGEEITVRARFTLLATGAAAAPLEMFGVCERRQPSAIAARVYFRAPQSFVQEHDHLCISYDR